MTRSVADFGATAEEHLWKRVDRSPHENACWVWTGRRTEKGYGEFTYTTVDGRARHIRAHRAVWELTHGPIPDDAPLDHHCQNRLCVNPEHLEVVTHKENTLRIYLRRRPGAFLDVPGDVWQAAFAAANERGESLDTVMTDWLTNYALTTG